MPKVHFIHIFEGQNSGEMLCSPYDYFAADFCERYECLCHDIRTLNLKKIASDDWVILGGGGLFEVRDDFQKTINALLNRTYKVVSWACGHNAHDGRNIDEKIKYERFFYLTVRDFGIPGEEYLPCVSCMNSLLDISLPIERRIGIIEHLDFPILEFDFPRISNAHSPMTIMRFIASSEIIVTNSYHSIYWATLMKKKVVLYKPFSSKFKNLKNQPVIFAGNLEESVAVSKIHEDYLAECRKLNVDFAQKILRIMKKIDFGG